MTTVFVLSCLDWAINRSDHLATNWPQREKKKERKQGHIIRLFSLCIWRSRKTRFSHRLSFPLLPPKRLYEWGGGEPKMGGAWKRNGNDFLGGVDPLYARPFLPFWGVHICERGRRRKEERCSWGTSCEQGRRRRLISRECFGSQQQLRSWRPLWIHGVFPPPVCFKASAITFRPPLASAALETEETVCQKKRPTGF